ncbi:unnamed protein product, partial [marine sediment metagenome]
SCSFYAIKQLSEIGLNPARGKHTAIKEVFLSDYGNDVANWQGATSTPDE